MNALLALVPVLLFLVALYFLDSFKLVPARSIGAALAAGVATALVAWWLQQVALPLDSLGSAVVVRYVAPVLEEILKACPIVLLIVRRRVGFLADAVVLGFAVGAGFALAENVVYLRHVADPSAGLWIARGLGTGILHGAASAIFTMVSKTLVDRNPERLAVMFLPGLALAIVIHSAFNHLLLPAVAQTAVMLIVLPLLVVWVFDRSERATREWVGPGLDLDLELLQLVTSEDFHATRFGQFLRALRSRFPGVVVADMYCLLRLELELSIQAKALVMARGAGLSLLRDDDLEATFAERDDLQRSIGTPGMLALEPLQVTTPRDLWHRHILHQAGRRRSST